MCQCQSLPTSDLGVASALARIGQLAHGETSFPIIRFSLRVCTKCKQDLLFLFLGMGELSSQPRAYESAGSSVRTASGRASCRERLTGLDRQSGS